MKKIELAMLLLLPFAINAQQFDGSFSSNSDVSYFSTQNSLPNLISSSPQWRSQPMTTEFSPQIDYSSNWASQPIGAIIPTTLQSSLCGANEVPNYQNICIKPAYIEGCEVYQAPSTCESCAKGYRLSSSKKCDYNSLSTATITHIRGCIKQKNSVCQTCAEGFYKNGDKCKFGTNHCSKYKEDGSCLECEPDYSLILSECKHNNLLGCKYETKQHTCTECYAPFQLVNQQCKISDCRILNDYGCVSCECGFYLSAERTCQPIAPGCLRYQKGVCKDCLAHYKLKGGVCEIEGCLQYDQHYCKECSSKYELVEGECKFKNCFDWLNDECVACEKGFVLKNGFCEKSTSTPCA